MFQFLGFLRYNFPDLVSRSTLSCLFEKMRFFFILKFAFAPYVFLVSPRRFVVVADLILFFFFMVFMLTIFLSVFSLMPEAFLKHLVALSYLF